MKKQITALALSFVLGIGLVNPAAFAKETVASSPNKKFSAFLKQDFKETLERDYATLHSYVAHPETYGIDVSKMDIDLGDITTTSEDRKELKKLEAKLDTFEYSTLDKKQQEIYDAYRYENAIAKKTYNKKYTYLTSLWSTNNGLQNSMGSYFSDYQLFTEADIKPLITLIKDMKRLSKDAISFSGKQADKGMLYMSYNDVMKSLQENIDSQNDSAIKTNLDKQIDQLHLDKDKADTYKSKIKDALDTYYFPSYTYMKKELKKIKNKVKAPVSMAKKGKSGKELYALKLQLNSGTTKDVKAIQNDLSDFNEEALKTLQNSDAENEIKTSFDSPEEILTFLQSKYTNHFPEINVPSYNIEAIPKEQSSPNIVAYFKQPPMDETTDNIIRYNNTDWSSDTTSQEFYQTFAHEGLPGHMYAFAYIHQHKTYDIEYLFNELCYAEGFATYVEEQSLYDLDDVKKSDVEFANAYTHFEHSTLALLDIDINYNGLSKSQFVKKYNDMMSESALKSLYNTLTNDPGIFISYYYGELKIYALREKAEDQLGDDFNEKEFHTALLEMQNVNFDIVERNINAYISNSKTDI